MSFSSSLFFKATMKVVVLALLAISAAHVAPDGLLGIDVVIDDSQDDWPMTVGPDSPWGSRVETGDMLIGWSKRPKRDFELRWHKDLDDLADFLCDNVDEDVYLLVENHRNDEGIVLKVPVTDENDWC